MAIDPGYTLITGATRGIGRAIVDRLTARGERVVGIARAADPGFPGPLIVADLADVESTRQGLAQVLDNYDVHRLVNNAGFNQMQALGDVSSAAFDQIMATNIRASLACSQAVLPRMLQAVTASRDARCRIVNMASRSLLGRAEGSVYSAAKAALVGFTRSWALELADRGITVNCVAPGPISTEMFRRNNPDDLPRTQAMKASIPMRRLGEPEEVAAAVDYFLSPGAGFTTGQTLFVCGGASVSQMHI